jgi:hypothetical protein
MNSLPQSRPPWRVPRARLQGNTSAVLRCANGQRLEANLQVVSLTGGLLSLPQPVVQGSQVKVMFLTGDGSVLGGAEMLRPVTNALQPFRFVSLADDDHRRLQKLVWEQTNQNKSEQVWMEKLRAASVHQDSAQPSRLKLAGLVGLLAVGLATAAYVLHFGLLR